LHKLKDTNQKILYINVKREYITKTKHLQNLC